MSNKNQSMYTMGQMMFKKSTDDKTGPSLLFHHDPKLQLAS